MRILALLAPEAGRHHFFQAPSFDPELRRRRLGDVALRRWQVEPMLEADLPVVVAGVVRAHQQRRGPGGGVGGQ